MTQVEVAIIVILLLMSLPGLLRRMGHLSLMYPIYLAVGLLVGPILDDGSLHLLKETGEFGLILLLFSIGLEIDLPTRAMFAKAAQVAGRWSIWQIPLVVALALTVDGNWMNVSMTSVEVSLVAAIAMVSCSLALAYPAWQRLKADDPEIKSNLLLFMVALEVQTIVILSVSGVLLTYGIGMRLLLNLLGVILAITLVGLLANNMTRGLQSVIDRAVHLRVHIIVLFVLLFSAVGGRLGLSAAKTAFFLGLFISRSTHEGMSLRSHLEPIAQGLLIPVFFVSLGAHLPLSSVFSYIGLHALLSAIFILAFRKMISCRWNVIGEYRQAYLIVTPNLTMVAIAVTILQKCVGPLPVTVWVALTGLFLTIFSILLFPQADPHPSAAAPPSG